MTIRPIRTLMNHATTEIFLDGVRVADDDLVGEEGKGFRYILDGMNAERVLIAAECIGDGRWFVEKATAYASERVVFGRPIGSNQGVQFPIARAHAQIEAADLVRYKAAWLYEQGLPCGAEANMAKLLAADASWAAANACLDTHGGFGFAEEYDVERKFRETRLYQVAPVSTNLILAYIGQHVLGMPRSSSLRDRSLARIPIRNDPALRAGHIPEVACCLRQRRGPQLVANVRNDRSSRSASRPRPIRTSRERRSSSGQASRCTGGWTTCWTASTSSGPSPPTSSRPLTRRISRPRAWSSIVSQTPKPSQSTGPSRTRLTAATSSSWP